jgi:hypothetical protein
MNPSKLDSMLRGSLAGQVTDGGDGLHTYSVSTGILNKQSWTDDKGWSSSLAVGRGPNNSSL